MRHTAQAAFLRFAESLPVLGDFLAIENAERTLDLARCKSNHIRTRWRMSSSIERAKTPFEKLANDSGGEHPVDMLVASRLPLTELGARIRDAVDDLRIALDERERLWGRVEELLNERNLTRNEEYFNLGYEYGLAAGRAEALERLRGNGDLDALEFAERLRVLVKEIDLPFGSAIAALLETAWVFALDASASRTADSGA